MVFLAILLFAAQVQSAEYSAGWRVGTLGIGVECQAKFSEEFTFRIAAQGCPEMRLYDSSISGINYQVSTTLFTAGAFADWHPMADLRGFKLVGGLLYNGNTAKFEGQTAAGKIYYIGGVPYSGAQLGKITGEVTSNPIAPYAGMGYTFLLSDDNRWKLDLDLGALYMGQPRVKMRADNPQGLALQGDLDREAGRIKDAAYRFQWWPVLSVGVSYIF